MMNTKSINKVCKKLNIICTNDGYITNDYYHTRLGMLGIMPVKYILPTDKYFLEELKQYKPNDTRIQKFSSIVQSEKNYNPSNYIFTTKSNHLPTAWDLISNYLEHEYKSMNHYNHYFRAILKSLAQTGNQEIYIEVKNKFNAITTIGRHRILRAERLKTKYVFKS